MNSFHKNIEFTFNNENDNKILFLDVLILRNSSFTETTVYRKLTYNDIYLRWDSFLSNNWKLVTLKTFLLRAFVICFNKQLLNKEIEHILNVFRHSDGYPKSVFQNVISKNKHEQSTPSVKITESQ